MIQNPLRPLIRALGYQKQTIHNNGNFRRAKLLKSLRIETVLDGGASRGQYGERLRSFGYQGRIVSYEPLSSSFSELAIKAAADGNWEARNIALSDVDGSAQLNISTQNTWSSLLPRDDAARSPALEYVGRETVSTSRLDSLDDVRGRTWLKLDVQGFEMAVLRGAERTLEAVDSIECELMLEAAYAGQATATELMSFIYQHGFRLAAVDNGYIRPSGRAGWMDWIFVKDGPVFQSLGDSRKEGNFF